MRTIFFAMSLFWFSSAVSAQDVDAPGKIESALYRASQTALIGGLAMDMLTTVKAKNSSTHVSYFYCQDGSQTCRFPVSVLKTVTFREVGWASWYGIQKPYSIVAASIALDVGILTASHFLYKKGGVWRKVAIGVNFFQAGNHTVAGVSNADKIKSAKIGLVPAGAFSVSW